MACDIAREKKIRFFLAATTVVRVVLTKAVSGRFFLLCPMAAIVPSKMGPFADENNIRFVFSNPTFRAAW